MRLFKDWVYKIGWIVWVLGCLAGPFVGSPWFVAQLAFYFGCLEGLALLDSDDEDSFSENTWLFYGRQPARLIMVKGFVIYLALLLASAFVPVLAWVGWGVFWLGFFWWLWDHFTYMGEKG